MKPSSSRFYNFREFNEIEFNESDLMKTRKKRIIPNQHKNNQRDINLRRASNLNIFSDETPLYKSSRKMETPFLTVSCRCRLLRNERKFR